MSKERFEDSIKLIDAVASKCYETIDENELNRAKSMYQGRLILGMEDSLSIAEFNAASQLFTGNVCDVGGHLEKINKVSLSKIKEVAKSYLTELEPNISVVGPVKD